MKLEQLLREHVLHRTTLVDQGRRLILKCVECTRTFDLTPLFTQAGTTSTSHLPLQLNDPDACPRHPGERDGACGRCRSEGLESLASVPKRTGSDPTPEYLQAKAALAAKRAARKASQAATDTEQDPTEANP